MKPTLTDEMRHAIEEHPGKPLDIVDPASNTNYVLIRADLYQRVRDLLERPQSDAPESTIEIPPGIRRSQEAFRRDLPKLLEDPKRAGRWVLYHGEQQLAFARTELELIKECSRRGLKEDEYYLAKIVPTELIDIEEIDPSLFEFEEIDEPRAPVS